MLYPNAPTRGDLSRRLGPVFAEQAAQPKTTSDRNLTATARAVQVMTRPSQAAAYKPTHGGYLSVGGRA